MTAKRDEKQIYVRQRIAAKITVAILDVGLAKSTWRDNHPEAYETLLDLRKDIYDSVFGILNLDKIGKLP